MDKVSFSGICIINKYHNGKQATEKIFTNLEQDRYINTLRNEIFGTDYVYGDGVITSTVEDSVTLFVKKLGLLFNKEMPEINEVTSPGRINTPSSIFVQNRTSIFGSGDGYDVKVEFSPKNILG